MTDPKPVTLEALLYCHIDGCDSAPAHRATNPQGEVRLVCRKCLGELLALYGWTLA
jgi:hypothetical protein